MMGENKRIKERSEAIEGEYSELNRTINELENKLANRDHELNEVKELLRSLESRKASKKKKNVITEYDSVSYGPYY
jgi:uncharacterized coiled-coil DUF342 family protein